jgi:hemoglobin-like flavoprotein
MALDVTLLRQSFTLVVERSPQVIARFYEIFFERYPEVRPMFGRGPEDIARQERMLTDALVAVLDHLEDAPWLQQTLFALGRRHVGYGVRDEMYAWVGDCLLMALAEAAGSAWSAEIEKQWSEAFGAIQSMMLAGAASTRTSVGERQGAQAGVV